MRRQAASFLAAALFASLMACSSSGGDAAITSKIRTVLQADRIVDASKIQVATEQGVVTLDGSVAGEAAHRKALEMVQGIDGVRQVRDRLTVTAAAPPAEGAGPAPSPAGGDRPAGLGGVTVEERTRERRRRADQPGGNYGLMAAVVGPQDDVTLRPVAEPALEPVAHRESPVARRESGPASEARAASTDEPADGAAAITSSQPDSPLPLGPSGAEDSAITARIRAGLLELGHRVQVVTRGGVVVLSGVVDTELEKSQALRIARSTKGVARVEDRLIVLVS